MRLTRRTYSEISEGDMTPMIDMTFQLIAFFMVLINFAEADQNQQIHLPSSQLAKPPEVARENTLTLQLTSEGKVLFATNEVSVPQVRTFLRREREFLRLKNIEAASTTIIVRADADAKTGQVEELIQICQELGFEKYVLRAKQEQINSAVSGGGRS
jgi:biopolymer transport protein ExbD